MSLNIWRWSPDWRQGVTERLQYLTDIRTTNTGREYRTRIREHPRRGISFVSVVSGRDLRDIDSSIWATEAEGWMMPLWWDVARAEYDSGLFVGEGIGLHRDWQPGGDVVVTDGTDWASLSLSSSVLKDDEITTSAVPEKFRGHVRIYPAMQASLIDSDVSHETAAVGSVSVSFELVDYRSPDGVAMTTKHNGLGVMSVAPNRARASGATISRRIEDVDFEVGTVSRYDDAGIPFVDRSSDHLHLYRQELWEQRLWWQYLGGAKTPFYRPTWNADIKILSIEEGGAEFTSEPMGYLGSYDDREGRSDVSLRLRGETERHSASITYISTDGSGNERFAVSPPIPTEDAGRIRQCSWLEPSRAGSDLIEIDWITAGICELNFNTRILSADL